MVTLRSRYRQHKTNSWTSMRSLGKLTRRVAWQVYQPISREACRRVMIGWRIWIQMTQPLHCHRQPPIKHPANGAASTSVCKKMIRRERYRAKVPSPTIITSATRTIRLSFPPLTCRWSALWTVNSQRRRLKRKWRRRGRLDGPIQLARTWVCSHSKQRCSHTLRGESCTTTTSRCRKMARTPNSERWGIKLLSDHWLAIAGTHARWGLLRTIHSSKDPPVIDAAKTSLGIGSADWSQSNLPLWKTKVLEQQSSKMARQPSTLSHIVSRVLKIRNITRTTKI